MPHIPGHIPPTGLIGAEQALQGGFGGALSALAGGGTRGVQALQPFAGAGGQATALQAALSGASGAPAQAQAFQDFQFSPGQQFLQQQGEQSLIRQSAALGGLGGGNIQKDLIRFGQGSASQALQDQLNQLNLLGGRGAQAAGQQANIFTGVGGQAADVNLLTGQQLAGGRTRAGEQIAGQIGTTSSALSRLREQQGAGLQGIIERGTGNLSNILTGAGTAQGQTLQNLAALLANIATGQGSQVSGLPGIPGVQQQEGQLANVGQLLTGIAAFSDQRLKKNIRKIFTRSDGVNFYVWDWIEKAIEFVGNQPAFGVIAQEIMNIIPDSVIMDESGFYKVDYSKVI